MLLVGYNDCTRKQRFCEEGKSGAISNDPDLGEVLRSIVGAAHHRPVKAGVEKVISYRDENA